MARQFLAQLNERQLIAGPERTRPLMVEKLAKLPLTQGNEVELLINGDATFSSIFEGISRATNYVLVQFYIIRDDDVGRELKARLLERARAGVPVLPFNTRQGQANRFQINFRNHRKIVIVDGTEAWVGGLNVGKEYKGLDPKFGFWRDTHLGVVGPVVPCIQVSYVENWHWASGEILQDLRWNAQSAPSGESRAILCLPSGPADSLETCTLFFLNAIDRAQERLWIASPYFVPDEQFISALQLAALRGVDVRLLIPDQNDNPLVQYSVWSYFEDLEEVGIKVFRYTKGFMHHKIVLVDDQYATVGTANFDNRSFRLNFEITLAIADEDFARQIARMLEEDFTQAHAVRPNELQEHGFGFRLAVRLARLTAPVQ